MPVLGSAESSPAPGLDRARVHRFDGTRCVHCNANDFDVDLYAEDEFTCPPRWLSIDEITAREAAWDAEQQRERRACAACGSLRHGTDDCG